MKLLAIDGNSIMNRAFYGIKLLSNSKGQFTNALTGFMNIYLKEIGEVKPDCVAVAFDLKAPTFRHKANAAYKANRKGMPEELAQQMPVIKELLGDLGIKIVQCEGYEVALCDITEETIFSVRSQKPPQIQATSAISSLVTGTAFSSFPTMLQYVLPPQRKQRYIPLTG